MGFFDTLGSSAAAVVGAGGAVVTAVVTAVTTTAGTAATGGDAGAAAGAGAAAVGGALVMAANTLETAVVDVAGALAGAAVESVAYRERQVTAKEEDFVRPVFGDTSLPYGAIYLSNGRGKDGRAYTIPHPTEIGAYLIHIGPTAFADPTVPPVDALFVHELTHVWQGYNRWWPFDYVLDSLFAQARDGRHAYDVTLGREWGDYNAEQQAMIVARWYRNGQLETDPRFPYIRDHIRLGEP